METAIFQPNAEDSRAAMLAEVRQAFGIVRDTEDRSPYAEPEPGALEEGEKRLYNQQPYSSEPDTRVEQPNLWTRLGPNGGGGGQATGEPMNDPRSRYTQDFAGGHRMTVVGGGNNGQRQPLRDLGAGPMPPPGPGMPPLSRAENIQLQRLQSGLNSVQTAVASGSLDELTGQRLIGRINRQMRPLQARADQAAIAQIHSQHQQAQTQLALQDGLMGEHDTHLARTIPNGIGVVPNADGSGHTEYVRDRHGIPQPSGRQKHLWEMEKIKAQNEAKRQQHSPEQNELKEKEHFFKAYSQAHKDLTVKRGQGQPDRPPTHDEIKQRLKDIERAWQERHDPPEPGPKVNVGPLAALAGAFQSPEEHAKYRVDAIAELKRQYPDPAKAPEWVKANMKLLYGRE